jgi:hypothetical protein
LQNLAHNPAFPSQRQIADFLKSLGNHDTVARASGIPHGSYIKWHRTDAVEMSAVSLMRIVVALNAHKEFATWLAGFASTPRRLDRVAEPHAHYDAKPVKRKAKG